VDPNIALDKLRELCREALSLDFSRDGDEAACDIAEKFEALDQWLSNGGFLPYEWQDARKP